MVFQHFSLFEGLTALENIAIGLPARWRMRRIRARLVELSRAYGLKVAPDAVVATLSAGERQRIELVRALLQSPRVLILDEPTSVLTPQETDQLFAMLRKLAAEGASILFISHKLEEVKALCSIATILRGGKLISTLDPRTVSARELAGLLVGEGVGDVARATAPEGTPETGRQRPVVEGKGYSRRDAERCRASGSGRRSCRHCRHRGQWPERTLRGAERRDAADGGSIILDGKDVTRASITERRPQWRGLRAGGAARPWCDSGASAERQCGAVLGRDHRRARAPAQGAAEGCGCRHRQGV